MKYSLGFSAFWEGRKTFSFKTSYLNFVIGNDLKRFSKFLRRKIFSFLPEFIENHTDCLIQKLWETIRPKSTIWFCFCHKFQSPGITVMAVIYKNSKKYQKVRISNMREVNYEFRISKQCMNFTQDLWIIHAKFQSPVITVMAVICKNSKNSEKFELRILNI